MLLEVLPVADAAVLGVPCRLVPVVLVPVVCVSVFVLLVPVVLGSPLVFVASR